MPLPEGAGAGGLRADPAVIRIVSGEESMNLPIPNSGQLGEFGDSPLQESPHGGPEIHSAKAHRCVDKVKAKGHDESSAWAICTSSIGAAGVYAKGHGGSASPKRKVHEAKRPMKMGKMDMSSMDDEEAEDQPDTEDAADESGGCDCAKCRKMHMKETLDAIVEEEVERAVQEVKNCKKGYYKKPMKEKAFSSAPAGSGGRFAACEASGKSKALCAYIGRQKFGNKGMARLSAKGRRAAEGRFHEVNHCHGSAPGHPCGGGSGASDKASSAGLSDSNVFLHHHLTHAATQLDTRNERAALKKGQRHNIYAIAHYLGAIQNIHQHVSKGVDVHTAIDRETTGRLASALHTGARRAARRMGSRGKRG
jgi:hypothetical protein